MNTRSSTGRRDKTGNLDRSTDTVNAVARPAGKLQKRWQPRQRRTERAPEQPLNPQLSLIERESLLRQQALEAVQQGNHHEAIALFTRILEINPLSARDYNNRGLVYFQSGQAEKAIVDYNHALELNPTLDSVYNNRANYYASQGKFLEAILDYEAALDLNPTNVRAWINQGITFRELEMYERAIECLECALNLGRLESHVYAERGRTYHLWGDWNCAIADYQRAIVELSVPSTTSPGNSARLRLQIEVWMDELLGPLGAEAPEL